MIMRKTRMNVVFLLELVASLRSHVFDEKVKWINSRTDTYIYTYVYTHTCICMYIHIPIYLHIYIRIYIYTYTHIEQVKRDMTTKCHA